METLLVKAVLAGIGGAAIYAICLAVVGIWYALFGRKRQATLDQQPMDRFQASAPVQKSHEATVRLESQTPAEHQSHFGIASVDVVPEAIGDHQWSSEVNGIERIESTPLIIDHPGPAIRLSPKRQYVPVKFEDQYEKFEQMAVSLGNHGASQINVLNILRSSGCKLDVAYSLAERHGKSC